MTYFGKYIEISTNVSKKYEDTGHFEDIFRRSWKTKSKNISSFGLTKGKKKVLRRCVTVDIEIFWKNDIFSELP